MSGPYHIKNLATANCANERCPTVYVVQEWIEQCQRLHNQTLVSDTISHEHC